MKDFHDLLLIWGIHPVEEVLKVKADKIENVFLLPSFGRKKGQKDLLQKLSTCQIDVQNVLDFHWLKLPKGAVHQGICAQVRPFWESGLKEIIEGALISKLPIIVCDQIEDPQNLGAIIRVAVAFDASGIVIPKRQNAPINGTVVKASSGAIFHSRICSKNELTSAIENMKEWGIVTVGLDARGKTPIFHLKNPDPVCLVLGSEARGIRKNIRRMLDFLSNIPINKVLDSLNVSNAAAVALYELKRRRLLGP